MPGYIIYCRKSSEAEDRQVLSIESQTRELTELAKKLNLPVAEILLESKSAKEPGRPIFNSLMQRVYRGEVAGIICWKIDRLARNPVDGGSVIWAIKQHDLKVFTPVQTYAREDDNIILMYIEFGMAQKYVDDLSKNVKLGLQTKIRNGWFPGVAPVGYLNFTDKTTGINSLIPDPERFLLLRRMWDLMLTGQYTPPRILEMANVNWGFRTRKTRIMGGKPMSRSAIYQLFTKPFYYGRFEYPKGSGQWHEGKHKPMITESEFNRVQALLGRDGSPGPQKRLDFSFTGLIRCGDCSRMITAEEKHQLICSECHFKFAHRTHKNCPRCRTPIEKMSKPRYLHYTYYHCSKSRRPICSQRCLTAIELENQIAGRLGEFAISSRFKGWAVEYLHELHRQESAYLGEIVQSQKAAYELCQEQISGLIDLKTSPGNKNGDLLSEQEYKERREQLLKQKRELSKLFDGQSREQPLEQSIRTFESAYLVSDHFREGDAQTKKLILTTMASNLTLKDKTLLIEARKPFSILKTVLYSENPKKRVIEPENVHTRPRVKVPSLFLRPTLLGDADDIRNLQKAQTAAKRIYEYFRSELAQPPNDTGG